MPPSPHAWLLWANPGTQPDSLQQPPQFSGPHGRPVPDLPPLRLPLRCRLRLPGWWPRLRPCLRLACVTSASSRLSNPPCPAMASSPRSQRREPAWRSFRVRWSKVDASMTRSIPFTGRGAWTTAGEQAGNSQRARSITLVLRKRNPRQTHRHPDSVEDCNMQSNTCIIRSWIRTRCSRRSQTRPGGNCSTCSTSGQA